MTQPLFLKQLDMWKNELREYAGTKPGTGACVLATAIDLWMWTLEHLQKAKDADGKRLYSTSRHGVCFPMGDAISNILAARSFIMDVKELAEKGPENPNLAEGIEGLVNFMTDLSYVQAAKAAGEVGRICAELVFGYNLHPAWTSADCESCGDLRCKEGPCVSLQEFNDFTQMRAKLDGCLTGVRLAKDRAALALRDVMIPEALDYPL